MKRILSFIIPLIMVGCTQSYEDVATISTSEEFYATIEVSKANTRTYVDENITTRWHADDRLTIFKKETYNREYKFKGKTGENSGGFTQVSVDDDFYSSETLDKNYAVYPHSNDNRFIKQTESFEITMPAEQTYAENTFGRDVNTMVAVSETGQLLFKNVGSFLRVRLWGEDTAVSSVTITSNGDEVIAGEATVKPTLGGDPICVMTGSTKSITLNCPTPVTISESESTPTDFWIVLPPVTFKDGFTVTVKDSNDGEQTYDVDKSFTFARNTYYNLKREVTICEEPTQPTEIPNNQIWYTTTDGQIVTPYRNYGFGATIVSNVYEDGKGVITFDGEVTRIYCAFTECKTLESITIPDSVTSLERYAFSGCSALKEVNLSNKLTIIGEATFDKCSSLETIKIPDSVTAIGHSAFSYCSALKSITIPDRVTSIGSDVFWGCSSLTSVIIPDSVTSIGHSDFYNCSSLTSINIPNSVTSIGGDAFYGCSSLTSITIPDSVTSIGRGAFWGCTGKLIINHHIQTSSSNGYYIYGFEGELIINCDIPKNFCDYENLRKVTIGDNVTSIGDQAFEGCKALKSVIIGNNVTSIGKDAFRGCSSLTSITIPNSVTSIGEDAFRGCGGELIINCDIPKKSFEYCDFTTVTIGDNVTSIGEDAFSLCKALKSVIIGNNVTSIGKDAFWSCSSLTSITIPDSVTSIGSGAFRECTGKLIINHHIQSSPSNGSYLYGFEGELIINCDIPKNFCDNENLRKVTIGDNVTSIGDQAFYECDALRSVTIGNNVTSIGDKAFYTDHYDYTIKFYCTSITPPNLGVNVFDVRGNANTDWGGSYIPKGIIYVPTNSVDAYKTANGWKGYAAYIEGYEF